ncbi:MAG: IS701 family transposase [Leptospirales bacterium]
MEQPAPSAAPPVLWGTLEGLGPLTIEPVEPGSEAADLWDQTVREHHPLGYKRLPGRQIKYLARVNDTVVGALSFSASAPHLEVRDTHIGWSAEERELLRHRVVNNSRFLILPGVRIRYLASHLLGQVLRRLPGDWEERFCYAPWLVESYIDPIHHSGASYRAAGFVRLGQSKGFSRTRKGPKHYAQHGKVKDVYLYTLAPDFRIRAGILPPPKPVVRRGRKGKTPPPPREPKAPKLPPGTPSPAPVRIVLPESYHVDPALLEKDEVLEDQDLQTIAQALENFCQDFAPVFRRSETRRYSHLYTLGLLSDLGRKSIEPIALSLEGSGGVRNLQRFVSNYLVDDDALKNLYQRKALLLLSPSTSQTPAMWTIDPSEFPKKGSESVGVAHQYCGHLGKVANCQSGVFLGLVTDRGHAFLDARLYLPEVWFDADHAERRKKTGVPETETFRTKNQIALELLKKAHESDPLAAFWIGVDAGLGSDRSFLNDIPAGLTYFASVRSNIRVLPERPTWETPEWSGRGRKPGSRLYQTPVTVEELAGQTSWTEVIRPSASFGVERVFVSRLRVFPVPEEPLDPPSPVWLFLFRSEAQNEQGKTKYVLCNAPEDCLLETMVQVSILRWSIERALLEGKSLLGMGHYENRSWTGWHRHMLHVFLAHLFLQSLRIDFKKKPF